MSGQRPRAKSDSSLISRYSLAAALALSMLLFACPSPISTDLILSVIGTIPSNGATNFDPGQTIVVSFNKDLDPSCLQQLQSPITISPNTGPSITLTFSYDSASKNLSIEPHPFLASNSTYTVSFETTLKDASGGALPKQVDLSFTTGNSPAGDIEINGGSAYVTTTANVALSVQHNPSAAFMRIANSVTGLSNPTYDGPVDPPPADWTLDPGEGTQTVYVQFFNSDKSVKSTVRSASIVRDTQKPTILSSTLSSLYYNKSNDASNPVRATVNATDATSGVATYSWTGAGVSFNTSPPNSAQAPAITISGTDGTYGMTLTVTDRAGITSAPQTFTITKDTVRPDRPTRLEAPDPTSPSPWLYYPYSMTWYWNASITKPNPYLTPADTFLVLLNGNAANPELLLPTSYGPLIADHDDTYDLTVRQVDAAGNQSDPLSIPIIVTPVIPVENSTVYYFGVQFRWRAFEGNSAIYRIHFASFGGQVVGNWVEPTFPSGTLVSTTYILSTNTPYIWYVDWSLDGGSTFAPENRSPSTAGTYYQFTAQ